MRIHGLRKLLIACQLALCVTLFSSAAGMAQPPLAPSEGIQRLRKLYDQRRYFELRDAVKNYRGNEDRQLLFFRGAVANKFNKPQLSIRLIEAYRVFNGVHRGFPGRAKANEDRSLLAESYDLLADNYKKIFQYGEAADAFKFVLDNFKDELKPEEVTDHENSFNLWNALRGVSPQTVSIAGETTLPTSKDAADLTEVSLTINGQGISLVLDTGANISTISSTYAKNLGLRIINTPVNVGASTGEQSKARLGIADKVVLGKVTVRNVVFLIFDDSALYIPALSLQLNGYIGFPLFAAFRQITFSRDGMITIPARPKSSNFQNMCLEGLSPLVEGEYEGQKMTFSLDTGANTSDLYPLFYKSHEKEIAKKYPLRNSNRSGVGSTTAIPAYFAKDLVLKFAGRNARFPQITILTRYTTDDSQYFYGNLGQDLVRQFTKMTLNFRSMSFVLE